MGPWRCSIIVTHYILRGGRSGAGAYCGTFFVFTSGTFSSTDWAIGAALSFVTSYYYIRRGGSSVYGHYCGAFYVFAYYAAGIATWGFGAALLLLHIMLDVVVIRPIGIFVVRSVFMLMVVFLMPTGTLVLLYHFLII